MLIFRVTRDELLQKGACAKGLALFDQIKAMQDEERAKRGRKPRCAFQTKLTLLHQLWLAATYPQFLAWLIDQRLMPCVNGRRANLEGASLEGANLEGASLEGANLAGARQMIGVECVKQPSVVMCANGEKIGSSSLSEFVDNLRLQEIFESVGGKLGYKP